MIQVGSKEEVAFLLALFGTHTQRSSGRRNHGRREALVPRQAWPNARASCGF
ncbi:hypothetical protein IVB36_16045 [Bradyrhizobium sp. 35]|uniref:hypothetical protein n=1 Tax=Bradyrhizobium sp. 35 TaxID=2782670 RepID=UPI001FFBF235|nr:hypothetical protein [Bradyrhizobium sp. 35]MCK1452357.1 hypothetical protein [Bradyrhizobium sp. 35]